MGLFDCKNKNQSQNCKVGIVKNRLKVLKEQIEFIDRENERLKKEKSIDK